MGHDWRWSALVLIGRSQDSESQESEGNVCRTLHFTLLIDAQRRFRMEQESQYRFVNNHKRWWTTLVSPNFWECRAEMIFDRRGFLEYNQWSSESLHLSFWTTRRYVWRSDNQALCKTAVLMSVRWERARWPRAHLIIILTFEDRYQILTTSIFHVRTPPRPMRNGRGNTF